ncbi:MAG: hypothetical protein NTZ95_04770 [Candidatus Omnitrophica bacterium]|nr:hypothetical protein [Candidatus Omnitrophota bacterium]
MSLFRKLVLGNKGLRYKLLIAFSLMSIIPLLACMYVISNYVFPQVDNLFAVSVVVIVAIGIAVLGLALARGLVDPVIGMAIEAKIIASGEYDRNLSVCRVDQHDDSESQVEPRRAQKLQSKDEGDKCRYP